MDNSALSRDVTDIEVSPTLTCLPELNLIKGTEVENFVII